ncbi:replication protein [Acinetobacter indicus]|uniref:replication protein n=1 Tax=Acinetobacter indicus TaxID=756892 RepID=UPI001E60235A|nr:replication protein [Acinetobacter indicus]
MPVLMKKKKPDGLGQAFGILIRGKSNMNARANLAHEPAAPQAEVVWFPKKERQVMSKKEEGYTRTPNSLIDDQIMAQLNDKAFKCLMFIVRQTSGFDRTSHSISITQFQKYCGIKKRDTVMACIKELEDKKIIKVERKTGCLNVYSLSLNQSHETGLPSNGTSPIEGDGTSTTKRDGGSPIKGDGTSTVERDPIKETLKENIKENFKECSAQESFMQSMQWKPNLHQLDVILKTTKFSQRASEILGLEDFEFHLGNFNAHHERNIQLTDNQKHRKFAQWLVQEFEKQLQRIERKNTSIRKTGAIPNRNVNDAWGEIQHYAPCTDDIELGDLI